MLWDRVRWYQAWNVVVGESPCEKRAEFLHSGKKPCGIKRWSWRDEGSESRNWEERAGMGLEYDIGSS